MKQLKLAWISVSLGILAAACTSNSGKSVESKPESKSEINELPDILLMEENGTPFSAKTLPGNTVLIFFSADCDHCQREAGQIQQNLNAFESHTVYFISMDPFWAIHKFAETYKINNQPNIHFVRADGKSVFSAMGPMQTPTICIFTLERRLTKRFDGETKINEIIARL